ncbi:hypothetical protein [Syntrophomonas palmitatica]|nr:hypothetical protein [Syntrophomonas palmitatica]
MAKLDEQPEQMERLDRILAEVVDTGTGAGRYFRYCAGMQPADIEP